MEVFTAIGFLLFTVMPSASLQEHRMVRRFAGDWNWNGQLSAGQANNVQTAWTKGDTANRDEQWSAGDVQQKQEDDDIVWNTQPQGNDKGGGGDLSVLLRGIPGTDFPDFTTVPDTAFDCSMYQPGYYADMEAGCQVFHICHSGRKDSFLCPLGTIFNQRVLVCDWWFNVNCSESAALYDRDIYQEVVTSTTTTTEKPQMPWSAQDLDKKRPPAATKGGWPGKQNPASVGKRGGKKSPDVASQAVNSWSRTDVQQKEVTHSWSSSTLGNYGSPSSSSSWNSEQHSTRPVWYGIDGQPAKDQTDPIKKRTGHLPSSTAPFGTRMVKSPEDVRTSAFHPTTSPNSIRQTTSPRKATTSHHRTSIVPASGVTGVWVQDTTSEVHAHRKAELWDRQQGEQMDSSATVARASWRKLRKSRKQVNAIAIQKRKSFAEKRVSKFH